MLLLRVKTPIGLEMKSDDPSSLVSYVNGDKNNYLFNGKEDQFQIGMYDYGAWQYDPATARWYANDKLGNRPEQIDKSPYAYAWNNPVNLKDPDGNCPVCIIAIGAAIGGAINVATHWNKLSYSAHPIRDGFVAFGIGAVAGGTATAAGAAVLAGGAISGLAGIATAFDAGMVAGGASSLIEGLGNSAYFHDPFSVGNVISGAIIGGVTGGILKGVELSLSSGTGSVSPGQGQATAFGDEEIKAQEAFRQANNNSVEIKQISQFSNGTVDNGVSVSMRTQNNIDHIFNSKHNLGSLVSKFGGEANTLKAVINAANGRFPANGVFNRILVILEGQDVYLNGIVKNGVPIISTMFTP